MNLLTDPQTYISFFTLSLLEIVLGIDNIIFIAILTGKLPEKDRPRARTIGLSLALITRILLLLSISWLMKLTTPLFHAMDHDFTGKDLVLILGGLFLIWKAVMEIHEKLEGAEVEHKEVKAKGFSSTIAQIIAIDIVFSLDSVITAVGMSNQIPVMVAAVIAAVGVMLFSAGAISDFVEKHPTIKILALSFLLLVGVTLVADGFGKHFDKGYIYFAMAFAVGVEVVNIRVRKKTQPTRLHEPFTAEEIDRAQEES